MTNFIRNPKQLLTLTFFLGLISVGMMLTGPVVAGPDAATKTLDRDLEAVVIKGSNLVFLDGTPVEHLFVYTYTGAGLGQIPSQIDEVAASGAYTTTEDNRLDANDEIVFMAKDLGERLLNTTALLMALPISNTWYEIEVIDPQNPTQSGWAYLVRSNALSTTFNSDYVDYLPAQQRVSTLQYQLGFAANHIGLNYLALGESNIDILDRSKVRISLDNVPFFGSLTLGEDNLGKAPLGLIKDGPVRVLLEQRVSQEIQAGATYKFSLQMTYLAYASLIQAPTVLSFTIPDSIDITGIRTSIDLNSTTASSLTTVYNANLSGGVRVDGIPDVAPETPFSRWVQISHPTGRLVQVTDPSLAGETQKNFYRDDITPETLSTGEPGSYGETGILFEGEINQMPILKSSFFVLPGAGGGTDNVGATYEAYFLNPLIAVSRPRGDIQTLFLPILLKND